MAEYRDVPRNPRHHLTLVQRFFLPDVQIDKFLSWASRQDQANNYLNGDCQQQVEILAQDLAAGRTTSNVPHQLHRYHDDAADATVCNVQFRREIKTEDVFENLFAIQTAVQIIAQILKKKEVIDGELIPNSMFLVSCQNREHQRLLEEPHSDFRVGLITTPRWNEHTFHPKDVFEPCVPVTVIIPLTNLAVLTYHVESITGRRTTRPHEVDVGDIILISGNCKYSVAQDTPSTLQYLTFYIGTTTWPFRTKDETSTPELITKFRTWYGHLWTMDNDIEIDFGVRADGLTFYITPTADSSSLIATAAANDKPVASSFLTSSATSQTLHDSYTSATAVSFLMSNKEVGKKRGLSEMDAADIDDDDEENPSSKRVPKQDDSSGKQVSEDTESS